MTASPEKSLSARATRQVRRVLHRLGDRAGVDIVRLAGVNHFVGRRSRLLRALNVDVVFDVGANTGQYAEELRRFGYAGKIVSFEPLAHAYASLAARARKDPQWEAINCALGRENGQQTLHVAGNEASSSFLRMLPLHQTAAPYARYVGDEVVPVARFLDAAAPFMLGSHSPFLKIDAQGYERAILDGVDVALDQLVGLEIELTFVHLYENDQLMDRTIDELRGSGFTLIDVRPMFADPDTGRLLQADGLFVRNSDL
jgi:FkbM family methyltransferase